MNKFMLVIIVLDVVVATAWVTAAGTRAIQRHSIIHSYLQDRCELISNSTGEQKWYECNQ